MMDWALYQVTIIIIIIWLAKRWLRELYRLEAKLETLYIASSLFLFASASIAIFTRTFIKHISHNCGYNKHKLISNLCFYNYETLITFNRVYVFEFIMLKSLF